MANSDQEDGPARRGKPSGAATLRVLHSEDILQGQREVIIEHAGQSYRLRVTSAGKLILTK